MFAGRQNRFRRDPRIGALVIVAGVALAAFIALGAALLLAPAFVRFDMAVSEAIRDIDIPGLLTAARVATAVGGFWPMLVLTIGTAALLSARGHRPEAITIIVVVVLGWLIGEGLKEIFMRVRPALEIARIALPSSYSFPSGHALASFLYFASLAFVVLIDEKRLKRAAIIVALCAFAAVSIALSRVYLGVHYLGDIVGSWLFGSAWIALVILVGARWGAGRPNGEAHAPEAPSEPEEA